MAADGTVGIVVVSHSHALARAAVDIAREMLHGRDVHIAVAAGLDETTFGTDAVQVQAAIEEVDGPAGVLVLMDLGSAVLSAELALDLLDPEVAERVRLCAAPLVEGLVAATVAAAGEGSLEEVESEAVAALAGKQAHLQPVSAGPAPDETAPAEPGARGTFVVANAHGLHARPAARLVAEIRTLDARVRLRNITTDSAAVPGGSLSRVATLGALAGHQIEVTATGSQAREAVDHVLALAARQFDEVAASAPVQSPTAAAGSSAPAGGDAAAGRAEGTAYVRQAPEAVVSGPFPASPGIGIGPAWQPRSAGLELSAEDDAPVEDATAEWRRIRSAVAATRREIVQTRARTAREIGEAEAGVFDAHLMLLDDAEMLDDVRAGIDAGRSAAAAWSPVLQSVATGLEALPDEYQRARAADVRAVHDQVLGALLGRTSGFDVRPGVLIAADLTPAQAAALDRDMVEAIVLAGGSPTSHSAILARSRGIPAVVGAGSDVLAVPDGTTIVVDGDTGRLVIDPDADTIVEFKTRADQRQRLHDEAMAAAHLPAMTSDGLDVHVAANVGSVGDASTAREHGADLAGLVRTEFLFLGRESAPSVDEQEETYRAVLDALDGRRAVIRTLDVGGDKPLSYVEQPAEANPFLGVRGLRLALARPELLRDQLRALCRVAADRPVSVMFPMVTALDELLAARRVLDEVVAETLDGRLPDDLEIGIMIEVPSAALKAAAFMPYVDFVSIGTNDLTQYTMAAERGNDGVAALSDPLDPGVLQLIAAVSRAAAGTAVRVAVCGEVASDPVAAPLLLGLGVHELSVAPYSIPAVKQTVRQLGLTECRRLAERALTLGSAGEVRGLTAR